MSEAKLIELTERQPSFAASVVDAAARDASRTLFEIVGMEYDEQLVDEFLDTTDGRVFMLHAAKLLTFINERNIMNLTRELNRVGLKTV